MRALDLTNQRFGRLVAIEIAGDRPHRQWRCRCDCGGEAFASANSLRHAKTQSCGCLRVDRTRAANTRHGRSAGVGGRYHGRLDPTYLCWLSMRQRIARDPRYAHLSIDARWGVFEAFLADMGERPSRRHTLDRIDNARGYEPGNCRWATPAMQSRNLSSNRLLTYAGETLCLTDWAAKLGRPISTIWRRLRRGESVEEALAPPATRTFTVAGETLTAAEWGPRVGLLPATIRARLARGWMIERALTAPLDSRRGGRRTMVR